jgi:hypothetical protein
MLELAERVKGGGKKKELDLTWRERPVETAVALRLRVRHRRLSSRPTSRRRASSTPPPA